MTEAGLAYSVVASGTGCDVLDLNVKDPEFTAPRRSCTIEKQCRFAKGALAARNMFYSAVIYTDMVKFANGYEADFPPLGVALRKRIIEDAGSHQSDDAKLFPCLYNSWTHRGFKMLSSQLSRDPLVVWKDATRPFLQTGDSLWATHGLA